MDEKKNNKKNKKKQHQPPSDEGESSEQPNIFEMLGKVSDILKQNPEMLTKVNKCVSNIIDNKDLMEKLSTQIKENMKSEPEPGGVPFTMDTINNVGEILKDNISDLQKSVESDLKLD